MTDRQTEIYRKARAAWDCATGADAAFMAGWMAARDAAAQIAEDWDHRGDPGVAMYASPRICNRIKWFLVVPIEQVASMGKPIPEPPK